MNRVVDDGGNAELPVAVHHYQNGFTDPPELPPQVPAYRVKDTVGNNRGNGAMIGLVPSEDCLAHGAKIRNNLNA